MSNAKRLVRLLANVMAPGLAVTALAAGATSCTPKQEAAPTTPQQEAPKPPPSEDIVINDLEEVKLEGKMFRPDGLTSPGMARISSKVPLARQQRAFARTKGAKRVEAARTLASAQWEEAAQKGMEDPAAGDAGRAQALATLQEGYAAMGEQSDPVLLQMMFAAQWRAGNMDEAMKIGAELLEKHPDHSVTTAMAPWVAYGLLRSGQIEQAAAITGTWDISTSKTYLRPYVAAWVSFKMGEHEKAREALLMAARAWRNDRTRPALEQDLSIFMAYTGAPVDDAISAVMELSQEPSGQYYWLYQLNNDYAGAGLFEEASALLDTAVEVGGEAVTPSNLMTFRNQQYNYELIELNVDKAADYAMATFQAAQQCGADCSTQVPTIAAQISQLAQFLHNIYSTTLDETFYAPAKKLYEYYLTLGQPDTETIRTYLTRLEETKKVAAPNNSKHDKRLMDNATALGRPAALQRCYTQVLQREPTLTGAVAVTIEINPEGTVTSAATEPAAGESGMAAAAACMQEEVATWKFPGRKLAGTTRVVRSYSFAPPAAQAEQAAPPAGEEPAE
ncbi:hypothetical protein Hoch_5698 [Haliangium ochraceum DSM 14365]|uniref:TonB family protein n=1 Tax=Haliangium ochraceum (strain DSM 14365 / JCM 11303 / SMP-2) TaxID=502025 RepID=D0LH30_HALO1|nr:hypothetical protein Hoch_5698 [Haliangium ochraceum DSM 14365]